MKLLSTLFLPRKSACWWNSNSVSDAFYSPRSNSRTLQRARLEHPWSMTQHPCRILLSLHLTFMHNTKKLSSPLWTWISTENILRLSGNIGWYFLPVPQTFSGTKKNLSVWTIILIKIENVLQPLRNKKLSHPLHKTTLEKGSKLRTDCTSYSQAGGHWAGLTLGPGCWPRAVATGTSVTPWNQICTAIKRESVRKAGKNLHKCRLFST